MNETDTKRRDLYETPEVLDIKPVTVCVEGISDGNNNVDE